MLLKQINGEKKNNKKGSTNHPPQDPGIPIRKLRLFESADFS